MLNEYAIVIYMLSNTKIVIVIFCKTLLYVNWQALIHTIIFLFSHKNGSTLKARHIAGANRAPLNLAGCYNMYIM